MAQSSVTPAELRKISLAISKLKSFDTLPLKMGAMDTQVNMIEPILAALGWNVRDPEVVQRSPSNNLTMLITPKSGSNIGIATLKQNGMIGSASKLKSAASKEATSKGAEWTIIANGKEWWVYHQSETSEPFMKIKVFSDDASQLIAHFSPKSIEDGTLKQKFNSEGRDEAVKSAVNTTMKTVQFADLVRKQLAKSKMKFTKEEISQSLNRIAPDAPKKSSPGRPKGSKAAAKSKSTASSPKDAEITSSVSAEGVWSQSATHKMTRKKNTAFMKLDEKTGSTILLPGSTVATKEGKTTSKALRNIRLIALEDGSLKKEKGSLVVTREITLDSPKTAAGLVAGTIVPDIGCWVTEKGEKLAPAKKAKPKSSTKKPAKSVSPPKNTATKAETPTPEVNDDLTESATTPNAEV